MPVKVKRLAGRFRVVEAEGEKLARNSAGTPVDGGGHRSEAAARRQATAINLAELRGEGKSGPARGRRR